MNFLPNSTPWKHYHAVLIISVLFFIFITFIAILSVNNQPVEQCIPITPSVITGIRYQDIKVRIQDTWYIPSPLDMQLQLAEEGEAPLEEIMQRESENYSQSLQKLKLYANELKGQKFKQWQGWIVDMGIAENGKSWMAIDMDEFAGDPQFLVFEYEAVRRIGLPDVILAEVPNEIFQTLRRGDPVVFSGSILELGNLTDIWLNEFRLPPPIAFSNSIHRGELGDFDEIDTDPAIARLMVFVLPDEVRPVETNYPCLAVGTRMLKITLTQPQCGMMSKSCYTTSLTIYGDGEVIYTKRDWDTNEIIIKTGVVDEAKIQHLVDAFEQVNYFSLKDDYDSYDWSDRDSSTTSITVNRKRKSIFNYHGDTLVPEALIELERTIRKIGNIEQFEN